MIAISFIFFGLILQTVDSYENVTEMITGNSLDPSNETRQESSSNGGRPLHGTQVSTTPLVQQVELGLFYYDDRKYCVDPTDDLSQYCLSLLVNGSRIQENLELDYFNNGELVFTCGPDGQLKGYGRLHNNFRYQPEDPDKPCYGLPFADVISGTYSINDRSGNYNTTGVKMDLYFCDDLYKTVTERTTGNSLHPSNGSHQESSINGVMYLGIVFIVLLLITIFCIIWNWRKIRSRFFPQHTGNSVMNSVLDIEKGSKTKDEHPANRRPLIPNAPEQ